MNVVQSSYLGQAVVVPEEQVHVGIRLGFLALTPEKSNVIMFEIKQTVIKNNV